MASNGRRRADKQEMAHLPYTAGLIRRLELIFDWYCGMIDRETGRLIYIYDPENDMVVRDGSPIRHIGSIWDIEVLGRFLKRHDLNSFTNYCISDYSNHLIGGRAYMFLDPSFLGEPSGIAHSAFLLLSLIWSTYSRRDAYVRALANGIVDRQRPDGSYKIYFGDEEDDGVELYPGEAMLALLHAFKATEDQRYLASAERAFSFYKSEYYEKGRVASGAEVFFANWQSQYGRLLFEFTSTREIKDSVKEYLVGLHEEIIEAGFYRRVAQQPRSQFSVQVACGLEGLSDCYAVAAAEGDRRMGPLGASIDTALTYLLAAQCTGGCTAREMGGFGLSLTDRSQRIDVTCHSASGIIKSIENGAAWVPIGP